MAPADGEGGVPFPGEGPGGSADGGGGSPAGRRDAPASGKDGIPRPGEGPGPGGKRRRRLAGALVFLADALGIPLLAAALLAGILVAGVALGMPLDAGNARAILEGAVPPAGATGTGIGVFPLAALAALPLALLAWALAFGRRQLAGRFRLDAGTARDGILGAVAMLFLGALGSRLAGGESPAAFAVMRATHPALVAPVVILLAPLGEELYLRGRLFGLLEERGGRLPAVLVTAVVFALLHLAGGLDYLPLLATYLGIGLVLGGLRARSGGLVAPLLAHALNNLAGVLALYLAPPP